MRIVIDTNVFVSGLYFSGPPYEILNAWREGRVQLVVSPGVIEEYTEVGRRLALKYKGASLSEALSLLTVLAETVDAPDLGEPVCEDPTDDKFFACAVAAGCRIIVSGDQHLHRANGFAGVEVLSPRNFYDRYLVQ